MIDERKGDGALVVGATAMIGWSLARCLRGMGAEPTLTCARNSRSTHTRGWIRVDGERAGAWDWVAHRRFERVFYCAGICEVKQCERHPEFARAVNVGALRRFLDRLPTSVPLVYASSDHVFGAGRDAPFTEHDEPRPISVYGQTRVEAEALIAERRPDALIVRFGLPIGPSFDRRRGHLDWLAHRHRRGLPMTLVADERRSVVWAHEAAERIIAMARHGVRGLRHLCAQSVYWRPELAAHMCRLLDLQGNYDIGRRENQPAPHIGNIELASIYQDRWAHPLSPVTSPPAPRHRHPPT